MHYFIKRYNVLYTHYFFIKDKDIIMDKRQIDDEKNIGNRFNEYKEFIKDKHVSFVIRKSERIVYGVYLLSQFIPKEDSLCHDLKKAAHTILERVSCFVSVTTISEQNIARVHSHLQYVSTLLSLSYISGYISESNIEIMKNEINYLHKHIEELSTSSVSEKKQFVIKSDMFVVQQHKIQKTNNEEKMSFIRQTEKEAIKKKNSNLSFKNSLAKVAQSSISKTVSQQKEPKENRELKVLEVIRDKGVVSIKDISSVVFDISEKTIQRTLQTLIDKGQIKKDGERRWAKYQLV